MGKPSGKKKTAIASKPGDAFGKPAKPAKAFDEDTAVFIAMSQELKDEGNRLYQKRDHEGAMLKYEKALKLLPKNHIDIAYLRSNMASCYMQLGLGEYPRAINECNLALEVSPKYSKALLRRAKCYEALSRLDLALRDVSCVLGMEPSNVTALEIADSVKNAMIEKGIHVEDKEIVSEKVGKEIVSEKVEKEIVSVKVETPVKEKPEISEYDNWSSQKKASKEKSSKKKRSNKVEAKRAKVKVVMEEKLNQAKDKNVVLKKTVEEEELKEITKSDNEEHVSVTRKVKLVLGEDIRWAHLPVNCSIKLVRDIVMDRFPNLMGALVKYKDQEGDLVTITTNSELRMVEALNGNQGSLRLYIADVHSDQEPAYEGLDGEELENADRNKKGSDRNKKESEVVDNGSICVEDWIVQFARLFKNQVGFETDSYLDLHEIGMKLYSEAMEETVTTEDSHQLFEIASEKFQEMTSLALFNWGNVHMSRVRKQVFIPEDNSKDIILDKVKTAYTWALKEYAKAGSRYEEALKIKNDFYEALLALGQQQYEQAKLCWYYAVATNVDGIGDGLTEEILMLYNKAEDNMERGMQIWEEMEENRLNGISKSENYKVLLQKMGLDGVFKEVGADEALVHASNMKAQIYLLWGTLLYERSVVEYKLQLPTWEECLEVAVEKFELAGASTTDIAVIIKNHCSNATALEGFKIDEIVHAWNEMYDASKWQIGVPAFRLEPLFRRKVPRLHSVLEHM